jgi:hypothetical protein
MVNEEENLTLLIGLWSNHTSLNQLLYGEIKY